MSFLRQYLSTVSAPHSAELVPRFHEAKGFKILETDRMGAQTVTRLDGSPTGLYYDWAALVPLFCPAAQRVLMLGLGGGEMIRVLKPLLRTATRYTGVDNDSRILKLAEEYFGSNLGGVTPVLADAEDFVCGRGAAEKYDVIIVDLFEGMNLPKKFLAPKFWSGVVSMLAHGPRVIVLMNVYPLSLVAPTTTAMRQAGLLHVQAYPVGSTPNAILVASREHCLPDGEYPPHLAERASRKWVP